MSIVAKRSPISANAWALVQTVAQKLLNWTWTWNIETLLVYYFRVIDSVSESSRVVKEQNYLVLNRDKIPNKGIDSFYD